MKKGYKKFFVFILYVFLSSVSYAYVPPFININTFNNSKELHLSFGFGTVGPEQSLSFSIKKDLYTFVNSTFSIDTMRVGDYYSKHYFIEGGIGVTKEVSKYWRLVATGGYAYGQFYSRIVYADNGNYYYGAEYDRTNFIAHRFFVALNYGFQTKFVEFYFGGKLTIGDYITTNLRNNEHYSATPSLEPNIIIKVGVEKLKMFFQIRQSFDTFIENFYDEPFFNSFISFGMELRLNSTKEDL